MLPLILFAISASFVFSARLIPKDQIKAHIEANKKVVAFYNVYAQGNEYDKIVQNQVSTIKGSGLLEQLDNVYYATMGSAGKDYDIGDSEKYVHIDHFGDQGSELQTLSLLYQFCHANPTSKVLYFHDKGSYHYTEENSKFCGVLNCFVLNPHCIDALDSHDTCGWRMSPIPHPHYSGNFWWARCQYVNTLVDPTIPQHNQTFVAESKSYNECVGIEGRFFAETWIGSGPTILPADCMNATIDNTYIYGYTLPLATEAFCHGPDVPSGLPCQTAAIFQDPHKFYDAIDYKNSLNPEVACRDNRGDIIRRSFMMYGEAPHTYLDWMGRLYDALVPPEGALYRFADSSRVYLTKKGVLHGFPNLKTFIAHGRDFDEVKSVPASERRRYIIGTMLTSA